jgi:transcriptional antiterminator RfaH
MGADGQRSTWFLVQLKPNSARIAQKNLERQGFDVFLPLEEVTQRRRDTFVTKMRPLFPGYLFVAFDPAQGHWRRINSTHGVSQLVRFGSAPAMLPDGLVEHLQSSVDATGKVLAETPVEPGARVTVTQGPFAEFVAEVLAIAPDRRAWLLIEIMGSPRRVVVPCDTLRAP